MNARTTLMLTSLLALLPTVGHAQPSVASPEPPAANAGAATTGETSGSTGAVMSTGSSTPSSTTVFMPPYGVPFGSGRDPNADLPSSSRPSSNTGTSSDSFDLGQSKGSGDVFHGGKGAVAITGKTRAPAMAVPEIYTIRKGDTLWDISDHYLDNPWQWPKLWSYNPDIRNPNWIYPGDRLRLRRGGEALAAPGAPGATGGAGGLGSGKKLLSNTGTITGETLFLRDEAFIGDPAKDTWGEVVGAEQEQMMLSRGNRVYLDIRSGVEPQIGQELTIFEALRKPPAVDGARTPPGEIVRIKGSVKVITYDDKTRIAMGEITEATDAIERGAKVGEIEREYRAITPTVANKTVWTRVLTSIHPHVYMGQHQLVFLDKGSDDGLALGNRLLVVRRGDSWRKSLATTKSTARDTLYIDSTEPAHVRTTTLRRDDKDFPDEIIAELRVLQVSQFSATAVIVETKKEIVVGDLAVAREGY